MKNVVVFGGLVGLVSHYAFGRSWLLAALYGAAGGALVYWLEKKPAPKPVNNRTIATASSMEHIPPPGQAPSIYTGQTPQT